jgi:hypothetical protein
VRKNAYFNNELNGIGQLGKAKGVSILLNALYSGPREASSAAEGYLNVTVTLIKKYLKAKFLWKFIFTFSA